MKRIPLYLLLALVMVSCRFPKSSWVDFNAADSAQVAGMFRVYDNRVTDLDERMPQDCYLPGGSRLADYDDSQSDADVQAPIRRSNTVTGTAIFQALLDNVHTNRVIELSGMYESTDGKGNPVTLSGKVMLPADGKVKRCILVSHYTIGSNAEAPSNCFSIEGVLCPQGYALIIPDYMGYGITADQVHPYLIMEQTATNVIDMYFAATKYLKSIGITPEYDDIYVMGYSQGGANSMAVLYKLETQYHDLVKVRRVFAGGGPYDVLATYDQFVSTDVAGYPVAVPLVMQGMVLGNDLDVNMQDLMQPNLYEHLDEWINSKQYCTSQVNDFIGTKVTHELLTPIGMDRSSAAVAQLYKAMNENSILSFNWVPSTPIYMMHSMDDEVVPFINATRAKAVWKDANIQYNFGHYGSHTTTALRFIYTVKNILNDEEK